MNYHLYKRILLLILIVLSSCIVQSLEDSPTKIYHTVVFDTQGGNEVASIEVLEGDKISMPTTPIRAGFTFEGWLTSIISSQTFDFNTPITSDITLYAKWIEIPDPTPITITSVTEGKYIELYFDLDLTTDITTKINKSVDGIINYTNNIDYETYIEYTTDDVIWTRSSYNSIIEVPSITKRIGFRIKTIDDGVKEVLKEEMNITFETMNTDGNVLETKETKVYIEDDDVSFFERIDVKGNDLMVFSVSGSDIELEAVTESVKTIREKQIIDSLYTQIIDVVSAVIKTAPSSIGITEFILNYELATLSSEGVTLGYVQPWVSCSNSTDECKILYWEMVLNSAYAFNKFNLDHTPQEFNKDGDFGHMLVHEFAHLLTLNDKNQSYFTSNIGNCGGDIFIEETDEISKCFLSESYVAGFISNFYTHDSSKGSTSGRTDIIAPMFITDYAEINYAEDLAESFTGYISKGTDTPTSDNSNAAYINKSAFFDTYDEAKTFKSNLLLLNLNVPVFGAFSNDTSGNAFRQSFKNSHKNCVRPVISY